MTDGKRAPRPVQRLVLPFQEFAATESSGGILLLFCTVLALAWANSSYSQAYVGLLHTNLTIGTERFRLTEDIHFWVNDVLMAIFFFVVGLEIKRQLLVGELASLRQAALPIVAALGGVVVPAGIYLMFNRNGPASGGWGIPMATDIAFALGVMGLLGSRVPVALKIFLTALAIVDDIAAVLVIAVFYTDQLQWVSLMWAALLMCLLFAANRLGVRHNLVYALLGAALWVAVFQSGVHSTIAGVLLAFAIPATTPLNSQQFLQEAREILALFEHAAQSEKSILNDEEQQVALEALEDICEEVQAPIHQLETTLHPWVTFLIMPLFALANAGIRLSGEPFTQAVEPLMAGIILGLVIGKPLGILTACWLAVRSGIASLPSGVTWKHLHGAGWLGGIGFTMSIFVSGLAFDNEESLTLAKLAIFIASGCAGIVGSLLLIRAAKQNGESATQAG